MVPTLTQLPKTVPFDRQRRYIERMIFVIYENASNAQDASETPSSRSSRGGGTPARRPDDIVQDGPSRRGAGAVKIGLAWRIDLEELERFLEDRPRGCSKSFSSLNPAAEVRPNEMVSGDSSQFIDVVVFNCDLGVGRNALVGPCDHCESATRWRSRVPRSHQSRIPQSALLSSKDVRKN
jgi:hypothetical protein